MEKLRESLNRITIWLQQNKLDYAASSNPGLTYEEIEKKVKHLPFQLPREVYGLYQWHNGITEFNVFAEYIFQPLEEALRCYAQQTEESAEEIGYEGWSQNWFPLFFNDCGETFVVVGSEQQRNASPVLYFFLENGSSDIFCSSLTTMMLTIAEAFETGAYQLLEQQYLKVDALKFAQLLRQNNPILVEITLAELQQTKKMLSYEMLNLFSLRLKWYKEPRTVDPLIQLLQAKPKKSDDIQQVKNIEFITGHAAYLLGQIGDLRAIKPLINTLKAEDGGLRFFTTWALGELGSQEAVEPLINALNDRQERVRNRAASSLLQLGAVEPLVGALKSDIARVRFHAVKILGALKDQQYQLSQLTEKMVREAISSLLEDPDASVREEAQESLNRINRE